MALTQISTDGIKNGTITGSDLATNLDLIDNQKIRFGTGNDLQIYHDGSNSYLQNSTGLLYIRGGGDWLALQAEDGENSIICKPNGTVELYHDNSKKFETTSAGVQVTGNALFPDSGVVQLGASQDLKLYHDGTNSIIQNTTGILYLLSDDFRITNTAVNEDIARFTANGAVQLYHNNVERITTSSVGVNTTGNFNVADGIMTITHTTPGINFEDNSGSNGNDFAIQVNANQFKIVDTDNSNRTGFLFGSDGNTQLGGNVTINGSINLGTHLDMGDNDFIKIGDSDDLQLSHNGTNSFIDSDTGNLVISSVADLRFNAADYKFMNTADNETLARFIQNGAVELYHDNSKKFETNSSGAFCTGELGCDTLYMGDNDKVKIGSNDDLQLYHDGTHSYIANSTGNLYVNAPNFFHLGVSNGGEKYLTATENGAVELYYDNTKRFETISDGAKVTGDLRVSVDVADSNGNHGSTASEIFDGRCKVFVNFRGTSTVSVRQSKGVSSVTDSGTGKYTINLSSSLANSNYTAVANAGMNDESGSDTSAVDIRDPNTTNFRLHNEDVDHGHTDREFMYAIVFTASA